MGKSKKDEAEKLLDELKKIVLLNKETDYWGQVLILAKTLKAHYIKLRQQEKKLEVKKEEFMNAEINSILDSSVNVVASQGAVDSVSKEVEGTKKTIDNIRKKIQNASPEIQQLFSFL
jgi:high-affinity K+ transport system ATPase subunit B